MRSTPTLSLTLAALILTAPVAAQEVDLSIHLTQQTKQSIGKGLDWLVQNQNPDGSWGCFRGQAPSTAVTALSCLALMASGSTPSRGKYQKEIQKGVDYMLRVAQPSGSITANDVMGLGALYDHGAATILLAELYGMDPEAKRNGDIEAKLSKAIAFIGRVQNPDGGFGSQSSSTSDIAITGMMWLALRSAHNAGIDTGMVNLEALIKFVKECQSDSGTFDQYAAGDTGRMFYPTSAGLRILIGMGEGSEPKIQDGLQWLLDRKMGADYSNQVSEWDYAGAFFAVQAYFHVRKFYDKWYPKMRDHLLAIQDRQQGYWAIEYCTCCRAYATAIALILLQSPEKILPMFQL